jgi:hypothetical protein
MKRCSFQRFNEDAQAEVRDTDQQPWRAFATRLFPVVGEVATEKNLWARVQPRQHAAVASPGHRSL